MLQHAIQKVAVAQAASTATPVQQIVKSLNELVEAAIQRVYRDSRKGHFPQTKDFNALAAQLNGQAGASYLLNGALALHLRDAKGWDEKLVRLLKLVEQAEGGGRTLLLSSIDTIIAEILSGSAALRDLIGPKENFGQELAGLVELFLGADPGEGGAGLAALTKHFAADGLPEARTAIAQRLMVEFKSQKRLCPDSLFEEFQTLRRIARPAGAGHRKYLSHEDLIAAFTLRSRRLVTHETLNEHMAGASGPEEKLANLLFVEENIIGMENKRRLAEFMQPLITAPGFEAYFIRSSVPVVNRLQSLAGLQARVLRSGLQDIQRREIAAHLDKLASDVELQNKVLAAIVAKTPNPVECATTLLRLCTGGFLTEGRLAARARELVIGQLSRPGFLTGYAQRTSGNAEAAVAELVATLGKAGISAETGLRSIAA